MNKKKLAVLLLFLVFIAITTFYVKRIGIINKGASDPEKTIISRDNEKIEIFNNGSVNFFGNNKSFTQTWDKTKRNSLLTYLKKYGTNDISVFRFNNYYLIEYFVNGNKNILYISGDDQTITNLFNGGNGGGGSGTNGGGGYFTFSTDTPVPTSVNTPVGTSGVGVLPPMPSDCPLWLLSICIYPRGVPTVRPATPTPTPQTSVVPDCAYWLKDVTDKAIISNTLCIKPSPSPVN